MVKIYFLFAPILLGIILTYFKFNYPSLPTTSLSNSEVIDLVHAADGTIVKLPSEPKNSYQCYISEMNDGKAYENLIELMMFKGWSLKEHSDTHFVFESIQGEISVSSQVWNKKYVIFHFPEGI